ncbi:hypothetical protein MHYP_G00182990 [Metynnis hypsauchen]
MEGLRDQAKRHKRDEVMIRQSKINLEEGDREVVCENVPDGSLLNRLVSPGYGQGCVSASLGENTRRKEVCELALGHFV